MNTKTVSSSPRVLVGASFLRSSTILAAGAGLPLTALAQGRRVEKVGLQLYTLRNEMSQDFEGTLARVAEIGYKEMEFAGYFGRSACAGASDSRSERHELPGGTYSIAGLTRRPRGRG